MLLREFINFVAKEFHRVGFANFLGGQGDDDRFRLFITTELEIICEIFFFNRLVGRQLHNDKAH